ncbi:MAG: hypothetical protein Q4P08_01480 [Eubacteriales bacterium]|nr:hypothetical protein [Eubacteriales bacterium]
MRAIVLSIGVSLITLVGLHYIRLQLVHVHWLDRYLCYGYFVPFITIPYANLRLALKLDQVENKQTKRTARYKVLRYGLLTLYLGQILLVLSNDYHQLILESEIGPHNQLVFTYGIAFYPFNFLILAVLTCGLAIILIKGLANPNRAQIIIFFAAFGLVLIALTHYILGRSFLHNNELVVMACSLYLLFYEFGMRANLIPINRGYKAIFENSSVPMQIIDPDGSVYLASKHAQEFTPEFIEHCLKLNKPCELVDNLVHAAKIRGGIIVWQEDIRELKSLREDLRQSTRNLLRANRLLAKKHKTEAKTLLETERLSIFDNLDTLLSENLDKLNELILAYPDAEDQNLALGQILTLLCFIKRRSSFYLKELHLNPQSDDQQIESLDVQDLSTLFDELADFAQYVNVRVLNICNYQGALRIDYFTLLYDFFFAILALCSRLGGATMITQFEVKQDDFLLRFTPSIKPDIFDSPSGRTTARELFSETLLTAIKGFNGEVQLKHFDESIGISLSLPRGGRDV